MVDTKAEYEDVEFQAPRDAAPGKQDPEGHDRAYHLKKVDGSSDHHIPVIKSLLARPDITLHEALVYGVLLDKLGPGRTYCCPTQGEVADTLSISKKSVVRAMTRLKDKGLVMPTFAGYTNKYFLPDRHRALARIDGQAGSQSPCSGKQEVGHRDRPPDEAGSQSPCSRASRVTVTDNTNKENSAKQKNGGNEEGAGSAGRTPAAPALSFPGDAGVDIRQVSESSTGVSSPADTPAAQLSARPDEPTGPEAITAQQASPAAPLHQIDQNIDKIPDPDIAVIQAAGSDGTVIMENGLVHHQSVSAPSGSVESVHAATAASGQCRDDAAAGPGQSPAVSSPILSSAPKAYDIFSGEHLDARGTAYYRNRGHDLKILKDLLASGMVTEEQFRCAIRGMMSNDFATGRGAGINLLANNWGEWQTKGKYIMKYPPGREVVVPRTTDLISRQASLSDSKLNHDVPTEHWKADWDYLPEDICGAILDSINNPEIRSVLLHGQPGTGKTTTAAAIVIGIRDKADRDDKESHDIQTNARFVSQSEFTQHALDTTYLDKDAFGKASWNGATNGSRYVNIIMWFSGILILDDVVHKKAPTKLTPFVIQILNHRHNNKLMTIVTSNLSPAQIAQKLDSAVASRLCGGTVLHFVGEDLRRQPQAKEVKHSA